MDVATLASTLGTFLLPFLPYLLKAGEHTSEEVGKKLGGDAWEQAKSIWSKLRPKVAAKPAAEEAVQDAIVSPDSAEAKTVLAVQLRKLLVEENALADEIAHIMQGQIVQRVLAEQGGVVRGIEQFTTGGEAVQQEVISRGSTVENVKQQHKR